MVVLTVGFPEDRPAYYELKDEIAFSGTSFSSTGEDLSGKIRWSSSLAGDLAEGSIFSKTGAELGVGHHFITAKSLDLETRLFTTIILEIDVVSLLCFHAGNLLQMTDGTKKPVADVVTGDLVLDSSSTPTLVTKNVKLASQPRNYYGLLEPRIRGETMVLAGHSILFAGNETNPEIVVGLNRAREKLQVEGHVYCLCTERRIFAKLGNGAFSAATWSLEGLSNFLENDSFGQSFSILSEQ